MYDKLIESYTIIFIINPKHKFNISDTKKPTYLRKKIVDIAAVTDTQEAKKLLEQGWEYKTSYPATISNIPHFILIRRE